MSEPRERIERLEKTKDEVVAYFLGSKPIDDPTKGMWVSDAKEAYYLVVAAYQMAFSSKSVEKDRLEAARTLLESAKSRMLQCSSELRALDDERASELDSQLRGSFEECLDAIRPEVDAASRTPAGVPAENIDGVSATEFELRCAVCGDVAASFKVGPRWPAKETDELALHYEGTTKSTQLGLEQSKAIFENLAQGRIAVVNSLLEERMQGGLDAYCPTCDKVYCREHYDVEEEWDEGFYDCSYGTCPEGHRRLIDD